MGQRVEGETVRVGNDMRETDQKLDSNVNHPNCFQLSGLEFKLSAMQVWISVITFEYVKIISEVSIVIF